MGTYLVLMFNSKWGTIYCGAKPFGRQERPQGPLSTVRASLLSSKLHPNSTTTYLTYVPTYLPAYSNLMTLEYLILTTTTGGPRYLAPNIRTVCAR